jgi:NifB/MoaA-like Fe-S oxidoreductase
VACVPLGTSRFTTETGMRPHTVEEASAVIETVESWQDLFHSVLGRRLVFASDEYYLQAHRPLPPFDHYDDLAQHENGVGMSRSFEAEYLGVSERRSETSGFFQSVDGAPAEGYRAPRAPGAVTLRPSRGAPTAILTGEYGASVLEPLVADHHHVRVIPVRNDFFGGNVAVAGLLVGADLERVLRNEPEGHRYLLPDACLSNGLFLDGTSPHDLPRAVEVIATDGYSLREALSR